MERTITIQQIRDVAQEAYNLYKDNTEGKNADYIPYLANINPKLFGISICLMNGEKIQLGDYQYQFGIESVSKVLTAILILRQYGAQKVLEMIGADATGLPFNSIMAILLENDHPSTPLVNAGAISADSMVQPIGNSDAKWKAIVDNMTELCGSAPQLIDELYKSESATNFNNRSIAWLLKTITASTMILICPSTSIPVSVPWASQPTNCQSAQLQSPMTASILTPRNRYSIKNLLRK